jgi:hypothetical protein
VRYYNHTVRFREFKKQVGLLDSISIKTDIISEVRNKITVANRCYFYRAETFISQYVIWSDGDLECKTLVRPVVPYGSECGT